jgi:putative membrane protein insertion efficiency factor
MPALRQPVKRRSLVLVISALGCTAALADWMRPPPQQISVTSYNRVVIGGYRALAKPFADRYLRCRFHPTCSVYSEQAMEKHGFPKGVCLTISRLFRCLPQVPFGTPDPP